MKKDVSIVIPTYNRCKLLRRAVRSCFRAGKPLDIEVIIVDDGSTDRTQNWILSLDDERVRYLRQANQGAPVARNRGKEAAKGRYVKFLDDDDRLVEEALIWEVEKLRSTNAVISYGGLTVKRPDGEEYEFIPSEPDDLIAGLMRGSVWSHPVTLTYEKHLLKSFDWNESLEYNQDKDFAVRVASTGVPTVQIDKVVGVFNAHDGRRITTTKKKKAAKSNRFRRQISIILDGISRLRGSNSMNDRRRRAAVQGLWQWAYMAAPHDFFLFTETHEEIKSMVPNFRPKRRNYILRMIDHIFCPLLTEALLWPARKIKRTVKDCIA